MTKVLLTGASGYIGKHINPSSKKAETVLGISFIPVEQSLVETGQYLVDNKLVK
jgi:hypothetical protein